MTNTPPTLVVVGHVSKGKSSVVSTLTEDDSVVVGERPGTTRTCREFPITLDVDSDVVFRLIDTPGFQEAPRALAWLNKHATSATDRAAVVRQFVEHFSDTDDFIEETRLLAPIVDGAGILYVVDGAHPFRPHFEAEMEILRWTGQPRMAVINHTTDHDHSAQWHRALDQYFNMVRPFNAHRAMFDERIALLKAFRELSSTWRPAIERAVAALVDDRQRRQKRAAEAIGSLLSKGVTFTKEVRIPHDAQARDYTEKLERGFHKALRDLEKQTRQRIEELYKHRRLEREEDALDLPAHEQDLFAKELWRVLGLSSIQLVTVGGSTGAIVGGALGAAPGGMAALPAAALGGLIGTAASALLYTGGKRATVEATWTRGLLGSKLARVGPHKHPNFPWVLLDRALLHYAAVCTRTHAYRGPLDVGGGRGGEHGGIVSTLPTEVRKKINKLLRSVRRWGPGSDTTAIALREQVERCLEHVLASSLIR